MQAHSLLVAGVEGASRIAEAVQTLDLNGNAATYAGTTMSASPPTMPDSQHISACLPWSSAKPASHASLCRALLPARARGPLPWL